MHFAGFCDYVGWCFSALFHNVLFCLVLSWFVCYALVCFVSSCFALFCFVSFCFVLSCSALFCSVLSGSVLLCFVLFCFILFCFVMFCYVLLCFVLFGFVLLCFVKLRKSGLRPGAHFSERNHSGKVGSGTGANFPETLQSKAKQTKTNWNLHSNRKVRAFKIRFPMFSDNNNENQWKTMVPPL